jgi:glycosyltransferase involved in cell wall biosynthesis
MKRHVSIDARLWGAAGLGTYLKSIISRLSVDKRFEVSILCFEEKASELSCYSRRLIFLRSPLYSIQEQIELAKKIPSCDLFWSPHFNVPLLPIRAKKRVTTVCDVYHLAHLSSLSLLQKIYAKIVYNGAFWISDCITTISEFSRNEILSYSTYKPRQLFVSIPPFDFFPLPAQKEERSILLFVGNLKPHKNLKRLVQAYAKIKPSLPLFIVGKKEGLITADSSLFQLVSRDTYLSQNIHFTGAVTAEQLKSLYLSAKIFIFPSIYEGFGFPPLEAMASGCPVIASKIASIPEVCEEAVEYIDPYSISSIVAGLKRLLYDEKRRNELIELGRQLIAKKKAEESPRLSDILYAYCSHS